MPCRSIYEGDGLEYEAFILRMINKDECVVRYLGKIYSLFSFCPQLPLYVC